MQFQLTSAFSTRVTWSFETESESYLVQWKEGDIVKQTETKETEIVLLNLEPATTYEIRVVSSNDEIITKSMKTAPSSKPELNNLYESIKLADGTYDATNLEKKAHDVFLQYFNDVVKNGDTIYTSVIFKGTPKNISTSAVVEGTTRDVSGNKSLFLPFTSDATSSQTVTLSDKKENTKSSDVKLVYTPTSDSFSFGGKSYSIGDTFELFGRMVTVADGSIVLVFEDTVALVYPFDVTTAANVTTSGGSQFLKNVTCNVVNVVGSKLTGEEGTTHSSAWVYEAGAGVFETTRIVHTLDAATDGGKISIGVRHTDAAANIYMEPVIQSTSVETIISAQDSTDNTLNTTINSAGIQFDHDNSAIYFGASQSFRIIFLAGGVGDANLLSIQSLDSVSGTYISRMEFSDST